MITKNKLKNKSFKLYSKKIKIREKLRKKTNFFFKKEIEDLSKKSHLSNKIKKKKPKMKSKTRITNRIYQINLITTRLLH